MQSLFQLLDLVNTDVGVHFSVDQVQELVIVDVGDGAGGASTWVVPGACLAAHGFTG